MYLLTEIPTIIDPSATINYPSATGSIIVGISVVYVCFHVCWRWCASRNKDITITSSIHAINGFSCMCPYICIYICIRTMETGRKISARTRVRASAL
jgi:hypothetical protein